MSFCELFQDTMINKSDEVSKFQVNQFNEILDTLFEAQTPDNALTSRREVFKPRPFKDLSPDGIQNKI